MLIWIRDIHAFRKKCYWFNSIFFSVYEKNLKYGKIILLITFIFTPTFFLIASHQILKSYPILINYKSLSITKIRPQAKIDNFAFKNSNIIIEGLIWKRKDYFSWKKFKTQKNNFINKFYFCINLFSYRFESNF